MYDYFSIPRGKRSEKFVHLLPVFNIQTAIMSTLELSEQEQIRRNSLAELRNLGIDPYPAAKYEVTATAAQIAEQYDPETVSYTHLTLPTKA